MSYRRITFPIIALTAVSGCAHVASLPPEYQISVADIVNNVRCELQKASQEFPFLSKDQGWSAGVNLSLQVVASGDAGIDPSVAVPLTPGLMVVTAGAKYSGTADSTSSLKFTENLDQWTKIPCVVPEPPRTNRGQLHGDLKIYDWLANLHHTMTLTQMNSTEAGYTVEFTIERSINGGAAFSLLPVGSSVFGTSLSLSGSRKDVHKLIIAYAQNPAKTPAKGKKPKGRGGGTDQGAILEKLDTLTIIDAVKDQ